MTTTPVRKNKLLANSIQGNHNDMNKPTTTIGQPSASSKPHHAEIIRLQESNNSLIDTVQVLANLLSKQSCHSGKDLSSTKESQEKITVETMAVHNDSSSQRGISHGTPRNQNQARIKRG